jgi:hypothetical protein
MQPEAPKAEGSSLSFDKAEYAGPPPDFACAACKQPIVDEYFQIGSAHVCPSCRARFLEQRATESPIALFGRAALYGSGAAVVGALVWWGVREALNMEIGIVAIAVGYLVGIAVRRGSGGRGGARYQALAMFLTYSGVALNWIPTILGSVPDGAPVPVGLVVWVAYSAPFMGGFENAIGLLIIGFALYEAWKLNRGGELPLRGPFRRQAAGNPSG